MLQHFLAANQSLFHFADGLVFFVLGAVALLAARSFWQSRLAVTRGLPWLASFGMLVGAAKWGAVFIPLQATYLSPGALEMLHLLQGMLLLAGHGSLLLFGLGMNQERPWGKAWSAGATGAGITALTMALWLGSYGDLTWTVVTRGLAAYGLGLPGAVLTGRGLFLLGRDLASFYPGPARAFRRAAWAFALSVPVGPLALPLDGGPSYRVAGLPVEIGLIAGGIWLTLILFLGLEALRTENQDRLEQAERREAALEERHRLAKELNDSAIQDLVATGFLLGALEPDLPEVARAQLPVIERQLQRVVDRLRNYLVEVEPMDWEDPDPYQGLSRLVEEFRANTLLPVKLQLDPGLTIAPGDAQTLYPLVYEALANVRRHARASQVLLSLERQGAESQAQEWQGATPHRARQGATWVLKVADDGQGFDPASATGPGLERLAAGAARLGGELRIESGPRGTHILLYLKVGAT